MIRVLVADDQSLVRTGLASILDGEPDIDVVAEAGEGREAIRLVTRLDPDVVLMDIRMPVLDGVAATAELTRVGARSRMLMLTTYDLDEYLFAALRAGASGFLLKDATAEDLIAGVRTVAAGAGMLATTATTRLIAEFARTGVIDRGRSALLGRLTDRERAVLAAMARGGGSNAEIAQELFVAPATVKTHVASILSKLELRDRVQAVIFAYESGLVPLGR
jgi:DNA-binding NarL/FixJ family response regulator